MTAWQSNPENETPDGTSPAFYDLGGHASEIGTDTIAKPVHHATARRRVGRRAVSRGRTPLLDEHKDPFRNPRGSEYSPEQMTAFQSLAQSESGADAVRAALREAREATAAKDARVTSATPEELARQHRAVADDWYDLEASVNDDTTLIEVSDPRFWKRPDEY